MRVQRWLKIYIYYKYNMRNYIYKYIDIQMRLVNCKILDATISTQIKIVKADKNI